MSLQHKPSKENKEIIVGLDLGTTRIDVIVAEVIDNTLKIVGLGDSPSEGMANGVVVNIDRATESIQKAIAQAEQMCGSDIYRVFVGVTGPHIVSLASNATVPISTSGREITQDDIDRAIEMSSVTQIPMDSQIIHQIPMDFIVDRQGGITNPIGMTAVRFEANVYLAMASRTALINIDTALMRANLKLAEYVLAPLASSYAVLVEEQKELGVAVVDLGGGTTDLAVYAGGTIRHASSHDMGCSKITDDLAYGLHTARSNAEKLKVQYGACKIDRVEDKMVKIPGIAQNDDREIPRSELVNIIRPRVEEILGQVVEELNRTRLHQELGAGIVLTGGGAQLEGIRELASEIFKLPVMIGSPVGLSGLSNIVSSPSRATGVGLVLFAYQEWKKRGGALYRDQESGKVGAVFKSIWKTLKRFI